MATSKTNLSHSSPYKAAEITVPIPVRRDSSSSHGSDAYSPLPPGRWLLDFHGNCSRCHHHHRSVRVKVNVSEDPNTISHVNCRGCHEKWLAIGGRNATQISLLSVESTEPDPVDTDVRYTLISMIRSTTVVASMSPVLGGIPEGSSTWGLSRQNPRPSPHSNDRVISPQPETTTPDRNHSIRAPYSNTLEPSHFSPVHKAPAQQHDVARGTHLAVFKQRLGARWHMLHQKSIKLGISRSQKPSAKSLGKCPAKEPVTIPCANTLEHTALSSKPSESATIDDGSQEVAAQMKCNLAKDHSQLEHLSSERDRVTWLRARYTAVKNRPDKPTNPTITPDDSPVLVRNNVARNLRQTRPGRCSTDLIGLGSHSGMFDNFWPDNPGVRSSTLSISDRISEAETAIEEISNSTGWHSSVTGTEQRNSGSPRPYPRPALLPTFPTPPSTVQQLRQGQMDARISIRIST